MGHSDLSALTLRQRECLIGAVRRLTAKEVGRELAISPRMVEKHWAAACERLGVNSTRDAVLLFERLEREGSEKPNGGSTELPGDPEFAQPKCQPDLVSGDAVREERVLFDDEPRLTEDGQGGERHDLNGLRKFGWIVIVTLALCLAAIASAPMVQSVQRLANLVRPPTNSN